MILGIGMDVCPARRWQRMIDRFGAEKCCRRILASEEALYLLQSHPSRLAERLAGRWALREAFGKSLGVGMDGWRWKELRYLNGRLWSEGTLNDQLATRKITRLHASITHDDHIAYAFVVLES